MPFPSTPRLDDFDRQNQGPPPGPLWATPVEQIDEGGLRVLNLRCAPGTTGTSWNATWRAKFQANQEVFARVGSLPSQWLALRLRVQSINNLDNCYLTIWDVTAGHTVRAYKIIEGVLSPLGNLVTLQTPLLVGDQLGMRAVGTTLEIYRNGAFLASTIDGDLTGPGYLTLTCGDQDGRWEDFGGGAVVLEAAASLVAANAFLADLLARRGNSDPGGLAHSQVRIFGGEVVETTAFEPDPATYRRNYYYNAVTNRLYRRVVADNRPEVGVVKAVWQAIGG